MASVVQIRSSRPIPKAVRDSSRYAQHGLALPQPHCAPSRSAASTARPH
jgi:hypothetical protein